MFRKKFKLLSVLRIMMFSI